MSRAWPLVALGEVLRKSEESVPIDPNATYREVTIKLWGKGGVLRREASGSEIAAARRSVVRAGQFILSRIDARNGAFGIVPDSLDGAVVSNDFPSFNLNTKRISSRIPRMAQQECGFRRTLQGCQRGDDEPGAAQGGEIPCHYNCSSAAC